MWGSRVTAVWWSLQAGREAEVVFQSHLALGEGCRVLRSGAGEEAGCDGSPLPSPDSSHLWPLTWPSPST